MTKITEKIEFWNSKKDSVVFHEGKQINIFVKFGYENIDKNFYEFDDVTKILIKSNLLIITYIGKKLKTRNQAVFPSYNTWFGIKG